MKCLQGEQERKVAQSRLMSGSGNTFTWKISFPFLSSSAKTGALRAMENVSYVPKAFFCILPEFPHVYVSKFG